LSGLPIPVMKIVLAPIFFATSNAWIHRFSFHDEKKLRIYH